MPYDPQWPQNGQNIDADRFRGQFSSLIDLINQAGSITAVVVDSVVTVPVGDPASVNLSLIGSTLHFSFAIPRGQEGLPGVAGLDGQPGPPFAQAVVDGVTTLNPGDPATVSVNFDGVDVRFQFGIPRGNDGSTGPSGSNGSDGGQGPQGAQGPPFANAVVDGVTTLDPGQPATVQTSFDGSNVRFQFGIPRGNDGSNGSDGAPGEVSNADLTNAINGTSNNTNAVATLDSVFADPDMEALRQKVNEMVLNGRR
jgi:hypothetical protein